MSDTKVIILCPVWGREYCKTLVNLLEFSLLAEGNLPALKRDSILRIATTTDDKKWLLEQSSVHKAKELVEIQLVECDSEIIGKKNKYLTMNNLYFLLHSKSDANQDTPAIFIYWQPDCFLPSGSLQFIVQEMKHKKYKAILAPGIRVNKEDFLRDHEIFRLADCNHSALYVKEVHKAVIQNLHALSLELEVDSCHFNNGWPSHMYLIDRNTNTMVVKAYHLHPIAICHTSNEFLQGGFGTIDDRLLDHLGFNDDEILLVTSSAQLFPIELSEKRDYPLKLSPISHKAVAAWANLQSKRHHANFASSYTATSAPDKPPLEMLDYMNSLMESVRVQKIGPGRNILRKLQAKATMVKARLTAAVKKRLSAASSKVVA